MTVLLLVIVLVLALALIALAVRHYQYAQRRPLAVPGQRARRILFPFEASALSKRALDAAFRLASAEDATLVPVFLARVPLTLPLDTALPKQAGVAISLQEAIEHRAAAHGVPVDARIARGRTYRHALRSAIATERFDRIVIAAAAERGHGFDPDDVAWLLGHAPGEIVVLRPATADELEPARARRLRPRRREAPAGLRRRMASRAA
jgi:nucleotide-binding universal stress UspA family protein